MTTASEQIHEWTAIMLARPGSEWAMCRCLGAATLSARFGDANVSSRRTAGLQKHRDLRRSGVECQSSDVGFRTAMKHVSLPLHCSYAALTLQRDYFPFRHSKAGIIAICFLSVPLRTLSRLSPTRPS